MKKKVVYSSVFLALLIGVLFYTDRVLSYKAPYGIVQFEAFYKQKRDSIDVLCVGTSHCYSNINPAVLWKENKIAAYNLATGGAGSWNSYYAIKEALKYQQPQMIVLEVFGFISEGDYKKDRVIMDANWGIRSRKTRWDSLTISAPREKWLDFWLSFPYYHTRYKDINKSDFGKYVSNYEYDGYKFLLYPSDQLDVYKGAVTLSKVTEYAQFPDVSNITEVSPIEKKAEDYLRKIIELADEKDIPLLLAVSPYMGIGEEDQKRYNYIDQIAQESGIDFINFNFLTEEMGLNPYTDFAEGSHLNYLAMQKNSKYLGDILVEKYRVTQRNVTEQENMYDSWERYANWEYRIFDNYDITTINDLKAYVLSMKEPGYLIIISVDGKNQEVINRESLSDVPDNGVLIIRNGENIFMSDYSKDFTFHQSAGSIDFAVQTESGISDIIVNHENCKKVLQGINIIIYDEYVDVLVDAVGFDATNSYMAIR